MAGDWIKIEVNLVEKPEVVVMADILEIPVDEVVGKLIRVWSWFNVHTKKGDAPVTLKFLINEITQQKNFFEAMKKVGWIIEKNDKIILPHWDRHNSESAKKRALARERQERYRNKKVTQNSRMQRDKNVTREEKRREEKNNNNKKEKYKKEKIETLQNDSEKSDLTTGKIQAINSQFDEFWNAYPRKTGKKNAREKFYKIKPDENLFSEIMFAVHETNRVKWQFTEKQFIPHPATWLNGERWQDEIIPENPRSNRPLSAVDRIAEFNRQADERERLESEKDITNISSEVHNAKPH